MYLLAPFTFLRFFIGWMSCITLSFFIAFLVMFTPTGAPLGYYKGIVVKYSCKIVARIILGMMTCLYINEVELETDYREYLGPDWKKSNKRPGSVVSNHSTFMDIIVH